METDKLGDSQSRPSELIAFYDPSDDATWRDRVACRDMPTTLFFLKQGESRLAVQAYSVCRTCDVRKECLDMAMAAEEGCTKNDRYGIFGGMSATERALLARNKRTGAEERYS